MLVEEPSLNRLTLEYHLSTLTNRSQENEFQRFAIELAKKELCPNLLPQTGPTGGGDSKVDTETYPVADTLSLVWHVGVGREASQERWGFAISAKADWRSKLNSDISKLVGTGRGYVKAYFITSQFVDAKKRSDLEDSLTKKHAIEVRILDRTWILDSVFGGNHLSLAIEELRIDVPTPTAPNKGPRDVERERDLAEVESRIATAAQSERFTHQFVDDCNESAILARGLGRPRTDVEGRFLMAERVAKEHGSQRQMVQTAYDWAWTTLFWFEDFPAFVDRYDAVQTHAIGSSNPYDFELLGNLWVIMHGFVAKGDLTEETTKLKAKTEILARELDRLSTEHERPSAELRARTLRLHMRLHQAVLAADTHAIDAVLAESRDVIAQSEGMVGYPLEPEVEVVIEMGQVVGDRKAYDELYEAITAIVSRRRGEVAEARMNLQRGSQHLAAGRPYDAIRSLGRALGQLHKHESRHDNVRALLLCGEAYERAGLYWAARGSVLVAASIATKEYWTYGDVTTLQAACFAHLKWLELRLGRLPHLLAWHEAHSGVIMTLLERGYDKEKIIEHEVQFDGILGILFLQTDVWQLRSLTRLPDMLDRLSLFSAACALTFALGHEDEVAKLVLKDAGAGKGELAAHFVQWRDQPAADEIPAGASLWDETRVTLDSHVLGCRLVIECDNISPCVELAESILAATESLLSTGVVDRVVAREPILRIELRKSDFAEEPFTFEMKEIDGRPVIEIRCREYSPYSMPLTLQQAVADKLIELVAHILGAAFSLPDGDESLFKLIRDDRAIERSIYFTSSFMSLGNVLGHTPKTNLSAWNDDQARDFPLLRSERWEKVHSVEKPAASPPKEMPTLRPGVGDPPPEMRDMAGVKHTQMRTVSVIREPLWDRAHWCATLFLGDESESYPPALGLVFKEAKPAGEIFAQWRKEIGERDATRILRVAIIRGISRTNPHSYRVVIGTNPETALQAGKLTVMVSRVNRMEASSSENLDRFLRCYRKAGAYVLIHGVMKTGPSDATPITDNCITKTDLVVRNAWEIGTNDPDIVGILADDDPVIPPGQQNAPVVDLLRLKRQMESDAAHKSVRGRKKPPPPNSPKDRAERRKADRKRAKNASKKKRGRKEP